MSPPPVAVRKPDPDDSASDDDLDIKRFKEQAGFVLRAPRRRPVLAGLVLLTSLAATAAAVAYAPRTYVVETRILAQRNVVIPTLGNPRRPVPAEADMPTRAAVETILRRDNLEQIIKDAELDERWSEQRPPLLRLKDRVVSAIVGPMSEEELQRAILGTVEQRLKVWTGESTITVSIQWQDAEMAYKLVSLASQSFLSGKNNAESAMISEALKILEDEAERQRSILGSALQKVQELDEKARADGVAPAPVAGAPTTPRPRPGTPAAPAPTADDEARRSLTSELTRTQQSIKALDESKQRRLTGLRAQLAELRLTFTPNHPSVIALEATIRDASVDVPELVELRRKEKALADELSRFPAAPPPPRVAAARPITPLPAGAPSLIVNTQHPEDNPAVAAAKSTLEAERRKYEELMDRIDSARIELHTSEAAFKYRFSVIEPAEVPQKPSTPSTPMILVIGLSLSVALSFLIAALRDLRSGRIVEPWQVERKLGLPVLAEIRRP